ncbi:MAG: hypothetical protein AAF206_00405 [Bacteroidota bacterium]
MHFLSKKFRKRLLFGGMISSMFALILLIGFLLSPSLSYAHQHQHGQVSIFHNQPIEVDLTDAIDQALCRIQTADLYDEDVRFKLALESEAFYPQLVKAILGDDVVKAFANQSVVLAERRQNRFFWQGKKFLSAQLLAHALVHNLQFRHHGFWDANPLGRHAEWKWEGYAEYIAFGNQYGWRRILKAYLQAPEDDYSFVEFDQGEGTIRLHIRFLIMVAYSLEEKGMDYERLLADQTPFIEIWQELVNR